MQSQFDQVLGRRLSLFIVSLVMVVELRPEIRDGALGPLRSLSLPPFPAPNWLLRRYYIRTDVVI